MHMPAEEAFWCFVAIFKFYLPGYFSDDIAVRNLIYSFDFFFSNRLSLKLIVKGGILY